MIKALCFLIGLFFGFIFGVIVTAMRSAVWEGKHYDNK